MHYLKKKRRKTLGEHLYKIMNKLLKDKENKNSISGPYRKRIKASIVPFISFILYQSLHHRNVYSVRIALILHAGFEPLSQNTTEVKTSSKN